MAVKLTLNSNAPAIAEKLRQKGPQIMAAVEKKMTWLMLQLQRRIQLKLEGSVLQHRTGKLVNSIRVNPIQVSGTVVTGSVQGAGGPAWYGKIHEYGGTHAYDIFPKTKLALAFPFMGKSPAFFKHVHHPPLPMRAFMKPSLDEMQDTILQELSETVRENLA
jgi:phage gpG-like protein